MSRPSHLKPPLQRFALKHRADQRRYATAARAGQQHHMGWPAGLLWVGMALIGLLLCTGVSHSQQPAFGLKDHAALVVQFRNGTIITECVRLREHTSSIWSTGEELLNDATIDIDIWHEEGQGTSVCQIEQEGCNTDANEGTTTNCFCECSEPDSCTRWHHRTLENGEWKYDPSFKITQSMIESGDIVGWLWSDNISASIDQVFTFEQICPAATPTPTESAVATNTPTHTSTPTETSTPTHSPTPTTEAPADEPPEPTSTPRPTATRTSTPRPTATRTATNTPTALPTATATTVPTVPPPTNTLVPTNTPSPTIPPPPTLEPTPTATGTPTPTPTPTIDQTATMGAILATELAIPPTEPPTPTSDPLFATATPNQIAQALLEQVRAEATTTPASYPRITENAGETTDTDEVVTTAAAVWIPLVMSPYPSANHDTAVQHKGQTRVIGSTLFWGMVVVTFMGTLLAIQAMRQHKNNEHEETIDR